MRARSAGARSLAAVDVGSTGAGGGGAKTVRPSTLARFFGLNKSCTDEHREPGAKLAALHRLLRARGAPDARPRRRCRASLRAPPGHTRRAWRLRCAQPRDEHDRARACCLLPLSARRLCPLSLGHLLNALLNDMYTLALRLGGPAR